HGSFLHYLGKCQGESFVIDHRLRTSTALRRCPLTKRRRAWAATAASMQIGVPRRSACGHGFCGSGVASQIFSVPSAAPLARRLPSGLKATPLTYPLCPSTVRSSWAGCAYHTFTVLSAAALASSVAQVVNDQ